jgi:hypothetical protein
MFKLRFRINLVTASLVFIKVHLICVLFKDAVGCSDDIASGYRMLNE